VEMDDNKLNHRPFPPGEITVPPLAYHEITVTKTLYRYGLTKDLFGEHVASLQQLKRDGSGSHITFDDGHISQLTNAVPILEHFSERATFFVTAGWTSKRSGYMNWHHLRELRARGHEVQSHGWSHVLLTQCSLPALKRELVLSKNELEDRLGARVDAISMPGGRCNRQVLGACAAVGYTQVFTSDPWSAKSSIDGIRLTGRWMATQNMNAEDVVMLLRRKGARVRFLRASHGIKEFGKSLIGDRVYHAFWRAISHKNQSLEDIEQAHQFVQENKPR